MYYIDDGSSDGTIVSLNTFAKKDERIHLLELSRNFGHQAALTAGFDAAQDDFVISLDEEVRRFSFKNVTSSVFYSLINHFSDKYHD